ncbi:hypothetical protein SPRG_01774 [Saprolegnia parasitica CBS 223.65]|uniref:VLIG-type G domain-containing protein n=1 Tax=Saprolegnia parasitica (strain CBS 223.65) TaxID=695850 RepID=A0A067CT57_SAPPC|nr:hypothetical protein SPRG_01774 [Saprolegnia parasitica CBS 223.65]KDO33894.1 hypothetical protein SPRG_01774 [Saprolegnia parasitica CBS 223.65]|eukprot:XP_012195530.1 hypothetical protein SPRG_01774 [Saprolegnia parasitica CBS 223.65]
MDLTTATKSALKESKQLQVAVLRGQLYERRAALLNKATDRLGLVHWQIDTNKLTDIAALLEHLRVLDGFLQGTYDAAKEHRRQLSGLELILQSGGGAALRGVALGLSVPMPELVLEPSCGEWTQLPAPAAHDEVVSKLYFASVDAALCFGSTAVACGLTYAAQLFCASGAADAMATTSVLVTYKSAPMKSLRLRPTSLRLSQRALHAASNVTDDASAVAFLNNFGSHVLCGDVHFGGVLCHIVEVSVEHATPISVLRAACDTAATKCLSVPYSTMPYDVGVNVYTGTLSSNGREQPCDIVARLETTGVPAASFAIYCALLTANNDVWSMVDRPVSSPVAVWDLLATQAGMHDAAHLVRDAWIKLAPSHSRPMVSAALLRARIDAWYDVHSAYSRAPTLANTAAATSATSVIADDLEAADDAGEMARLFASLLEYDAAFNLDTAVPCMRRPAVQKRLSDLVGQPLRPLDTLYDQILKTLLVEAVPPVRLAWDVDVELSRSALMAAIVSDIQDTDALAWKPPAMATVDVPYALEAIASTLFAAPTPDTPRVMALCHKLVAASGCDAFWKVAMKYGWELEGGFACELQENHVRAMVGAMHEAYVDDPDATDSDDDEPVRAFKSSSLLPLSAPTGRTLQDLLTAAPKPSEDLPALVWFVLKHRLSFDEEIYASSTTKGAKRTARQGSKKSTKKFSQNPVVLDALESFTAPLTPGARAEVYRALLDQQFLVPCVLSTARDFRRLVSGLELVETATTAGVRCVAKDTTATRVAVISGRPTRCSVSHKWIEKVFHVNSAHCLDRSLGSCFTEHATVAELGWGFVKSASPNCTTVMLLHIVGVCSSQLCRFVESFADVVVVDGVVSSLQSHPRAFRWQEASDDEVDSDSDAGDNPVLLRCPLHLVYKKIADRISSINSALSSTVRVPVGHLSFGTEDVVLNTCTTVADQVFAATDFSTLRSSTLRLQTLFAEESTLQLRLQRQTLAPDRQLLQCKIDKLQLRYVDLVAPVAAHALVQYFVNVLQQPMVAQREMLFLDLECRLNLERRLLKSKGVDARASVTGVEHLWRELSHLFTIHPSTFAELPSLAAQHLVDGFPLELMDGDAASVNTNWIKAVLRALGGLLPRGARVFVLSISGIQSSGKSTLLNYMFGVRLRTDLAQCTTGINLQLLACEGCPSYEYVLLLDTEGLQSPERIRLPDLVWRDNRMATLSILPADAAVVLTKGESTNTTNDVLSIVHSVFVNSGLVEAHTGHVATKIYFAFSQIDVSDTTKMATSISELLESLKERAADIQELRGTSLASETGLLRNFKVDKNHETQSDVRFFGTTDASSSPLKPNDFSKRVLRFRDYIQAHATDGDRKVRTVAQIMDDLDLVWRCIGSANFELDFKSVHERLVYDSLVKGMNDHTSNLAAAYAMAFDKTLELMTSYCGSNLENLALECSTFQKFMEDKVKDHVLEESKAFRAALSLPKYAKWASDMDRAWGHSKVAHLKHARRLVRAKYDHLFLHETHVQRYKDALLKQVLALRDDPQRTVRDFDELFRGFLADVRAKDAPLAGKVRLLTMEALHTSNIFTIDELNMVRSRLANVDRYSPGVVTEVARDLQKQLSHMAPADKAAGLSSLISTLGSELAAIQSKWDESNSIVARVAACEGAMRQFAKDVCNGLEAADLLVRTLQTWLKDQLPKAFEEELVSQVSVSLQSAPWVRDAAAMQAELDLALLQSIRRHDVKLVLDRIANPVAHTMEVMTGLIDVAVQQCFVQVSNELVASIECALERAARVAAKAESQRGAAFLAELRAALLSSLKRRGTSCLIESLPRPSSDVFSCENQDPHLFASADATVPRRLLQTLMTCKRRLRPSNQASVPIATSVRQHIHEESFGNANGVVPRCGKPCPMCKCPCTKALGHVSSEDRSHDTHHQPQGLVGTYEYEPLHYLVVDSCPTSVEKDADIVFRDGTRHRYREFDKAFPDWAIPHATQPLPLREFIFAKYQKQLANKFKRPASIAIPPSYQHGLRNLERQISYVARPVQTLGTSRPATRQATRREASS